METITESMSRWVFFDGRLFHVDDAAAVPGMIKSFLTDDNTEAIDTSLIDDFLGNFKIRDP